MPRNTVTGTGWSRPCEHSRTRVLRQVEVDSKTNEIPAVRKLAAALDLAGRAVTLDAQPAQLAALIRNHWHIENRLHYVRDFTYDEDRCRVWVRDLPRNLACLTNAAISIIRCQPEFRWVPEANRHDAGRP